jgi:hypothetical protein
MDVVEEGADSASIDVLRFGEGITPGMIAVARRDDDIIVTLTSTGDEVRLSGWFIVPGGTIERLEFHDATFWTAVQLEGHIALPNQPPAIISPLEDQLAVEDAAFAYTIPGDAFADPDPADALIYSATLADGAPLPSWLTFDASIRTFTGTPVNENVGVLEVQVMANDGGGQPASDVFRLTVSNTNDAPMLAVPIADQRATAGASFHFVVAQESFIDADNGDSLTYSATLSNGTALPYWLTFDPLESTFSGMPSRNDMGTLTIDVTATDQSDSSAVGTFDLTVAPSPLLGAQIKELTFHGSGNASGTISGLIQELLRQLAVGNHAVFENQALNLLNAMASFAPPPGGEQTLLSDPSSALDPLIAATAQ